MLLISHDINIIRGICPKSMLLEKGHLICIGDTEEVCEVYGYEGKRRERLKRYRQTSLMIIARHCAGSSLRYINL